jgi:hypothetical protein
MLPVSAAWLSYKQSSKHKGKQQCLEKMGGTMHQSLSPTVGTLLERVQSDLPYFRQVELTGRKYLIKQSVTPLSQYQMLARLSFLVERLTAAHSLCKFMTEMKGSSAGLIPLKNLRQTSGTYAMCLLLIDDMLEASRLVKEFAKSL